MDERKVFKMVVNANCSKRQFGFSGFGVWVMVMMGFIKRYFRVLSLFIECFNDLNVIRERRRKHLSPSFHLQTRPYKYSFLSASCKC